jgi:hypothetical protein
LTPVSATPDSHALRRERHFRFSEELVMRIPFVVVLSSALLITGITPSLSQTTPSSPVSPASVADHDGYLRAVKLRMAEWHAKLGDFGARVSGGTTAAGKEAEAELSRAWANVELAADRLGAAGTAGWRKAKVAYERAGESLDAAWARFKPTKA